MTVTNDTASSLGVHANFAMYIDGERENALQSSFAPIVVWSIESGASQVVSGQFADSPHPMLTGDDPSVWFPALSEVEHAARTSGDIDLAAATEDVRSMAYDEVALAISESDEFPEIQIVEVCERGRSQPDADHRRRRSMALAEHGPLLPVGPQRRLLRRRP